jgi:hypothetical protein
MYLETSLNFPRIGVELTGIRATPTHFRVCPPSNADLRPLHWKFQATNDRNYQYFEGTQWDTLADFPNEEISAPKVYKIADSCKKSYRAFRILMVGENTNGDNVLSLGSGMKLRYR